MNGELLRSGWQRARDGRILAGVCAGFAAAKGVSPWLVRGVALFAVVVTLGLAVVVYGILAVILPEEGAE
jgi:phage shock protein PspC (stress-responsive transcriptional regulator)